MSYLESDKRRYSEGRGKVVAKFSVKKISRYNRACLEFYGTKDFVLQNACLTESELHNCLEKEEFNAWHISDLVVFDKPMELGEFKTVEYDECGKFIAPSRKLTRPPQSYCYVEVTL